MSLSGTEHFQSIGTATNRTDVYKLTLYRVKVINVNREIKINVVAMIAFATTLADMPRKPLPVSEKKVQIGARVDPKLFAAMSDLADADDRTLSYMVERAVQEYVARHAPKLRADKRRKP